MVDISKAKPDIESAQQAPQGVEVKRSKNIEAELEALGKSELRFLSRTELLEILLDYAKDNENLKKDILKLEDKLSDKQLKIKKFGSIAEASLALNGVFEAAEASCTQYVENAKQICEKQLAASEKKLKDAKKEADKMLEEAKAQCTDIEGEKAKLLSDTVLECEKMKKITAEECERKIREVDNECERRLTYTEKQVTDNWNVLAKKLDDFYECHKGLKELIDQGFLNIPERGMVNET